MSTFSLLPTDLRVPCQSFQCYERAAFTLGKSDAPRGTEYIICEKCANELIEHIVNSVEFIKAPFEDGPEDTLDTLEGKLVSDWTIADLKARAEELGLPVKSKMNKADLVGLIASHE